MPYSSVKSLPGYVKKYDSVIQRQFMHVFNSVFKNTNSEARAVKASNSILKKRFKKKDSMEKNSHGDYLNMMIDDFLGNLKS